MKKSDQYQMEPYEALANAIIVQAVKDYREANVKLSKSRKSKQAQYTHDECISFFRSKWFSVLTDIQPEVLIRKLDKEVQNDS